MNTLSAEQGRPTAVLIAEPGECYGMPGPSGAYDALGLALRAQLRSAVLQEVDGWLDEREIVGLKRFLGRRLAGGRGRASTANVLAAIFIRLRHGEAVLNLSEIAAETGYSRPSVYRAVEYVTAPKAGRPKLLRVKPRKTGPRRPGWWRIRPDIIPSKDEFWRMMESRKYALSSLSVNLPNDPIETDTARPQAVLAAEVPLNASSLQGATRPHSTQVDDPQDLLRWLDSPAVDLDRGPTFGEKRKLAAALRLCRTNYAISDAVLDALFWRTSLRLRVWRSAVLALVDAGERFVRPKPPQRSPRMGDIITIDLSDPPPPEHWSKQSPRELQWRGRSAVKQIAAQPDGVDEFLRVLELGPPLTGGAAARRAAILDGMIEETEASLAAIIRAAESARRKRRGTPCPECAKPIRAETRKPRRRFDPPARYKIVDGHVKAVPRKTRMLAEYSEHGVYDFYREISEYPDEPDGIWQTRRGPHRCPERLARKLRRLRAEREELSVDHLSLVRQPDPVNRTRARIKGIDRALGRLQPGRDRERIVWLTSKRTRLVQELKLERSRWIASTDLPLEQRVWLKLSEGRATAAVLASDLGVAEAEVSEVLGSLAEKDWARLYHARKGIWCALGVRWPNERLPWEEIEGSDDDA